MNRLMIVELYSYKKKVLGLDDYYIEYECRYDPSKNGKWIYLFNPVLTEIKTENIKQKRIFKTHLRRNRNGVLMMYTVHSAE